MDEEKEYGGPEQFEAAAERRYDEQEFPGFGWFRARSLSELERSEWETAKFDDATKKPGDGLRETKAHLIVLCSVNGKGERRLSDSHVPKVMAADSAVTGAIFEFCRKHVGIPTRDVDAIAALKEIRKNSAAAPA
jgi:hypothetical protein